MGNTPPLQPAVQLILSLTATLSTSFSECWMPGFSNSFGYLLCVCVCACWCLLCVTVQHAPVSVPWIRTSVYVLHGQDRGRPHPTCPRCRGQECNWDMKCKVCANLRGTARQRYEYLLDRRVRKRAQRRRTAANKAAKSSSSSSGWKDHALFFSFTSSSFLSCLLYTSPSPRDGLLSRMPSSA